MLQTEVLRKGKKEILVNVGSAKAEALLALGWVGTASKRTATQEAPPVPETPVQESGQTESKKKA